jgi:hypothetical protein
MDNKWHLNNIPMYGHFYWGNEKLPYLRALSVISFHIHNRNFETFLYIPKKRFTGKNTWKSSEQNYEVTAEDYFPYLRQNYPAINIVEFDFDTIGVDSNMPEIFKCEFLKWHLLSTTGGIWSDMDIVYFKSMTAFNKNIMGKKDAQTFHCNNNSVGFLLASKQNMFYKKIFDYAKKNFDPIYYQNIGPDIFTKLNLFNPIIMSQNRIEVLDMDIVYPVSWKNIDDIFIRDKSIMFTKNTIGLHWFAGHQMAAKFINEMNETNQINYNNTLSKAIRNCFQEEKPNEYKNKFKIITTLKNAEKYIGKCIDSVISQTYTNWEMVIVDDGSTDNTANEIKKRKHDKIHPLIYLDSKSSKTENIKIGIKYICDNDNDIIVMLDGDDWLSGDDVLEYLNNIYTDNIWLTYGQFEPADKKYSNFCQPIDAKTYRKNGEWLTSHLKTFRHWLFKKINIESFRDKNNTRYLCTDDAAMMLPMIEMAGNSHIKFIEKVLYVYNNLNENCMMVNHGKEMEATKKEVYEKIPYKEIKKVQVSILITTFKRDHLLKWNLKSLARQNIDYDFEVVILDEYHETENMKALVLEYIDVLNIRYINTGKNKKAPDEWRVPGFAFNIGIKQAFGDYIILSCAEIYSKGNTINELIKPLLTNLKILSTPNNFYDDRTGDYLKCLEKGLPEKLPIGSNLNKLLPFFMAFSKSELFDIGGYDEDFKGIAREDDNFIGRLKNNGCKYAFVNSEAIHLFHERFDYQKIDIKPFVMYNDKLYKERLNDKKANVSKNWGDINKSFEGKIK